LIGPASDYVEYVGGVPRALLAAVGAALRFDVPDDSQSVELQQLLRRAPAEDIVAEVMGVERGETLFEPLVEVVRAAER
jgi:mannitol-1-phosphate 5-dehydrogenase